jgi:hypothetical protein
MQTDPSQIGATERSERSPRRISADRLTHLAESVVLRLARIALPPAASHCVSSVSPFQRPPGPQLYPIELWGNQQLIVVP